FRRRRAKLVDLAEAIRRPLQAGDPAAAAAALKQSRSVEAEIVGEALGWQSGGPDAVEQILAKAVRQRRKSFESGLLFLGTLGNNAPFIGLFGTVLGIVTAFRELGATQAGSTAGMGNVMGGIAEALVATAIGIMVALPAVIAYNIFQKKASDIEENAATLGNVVLAAMKGRLAGLEKSGGAPQVAASAEDSGPAASALPDGARLATAEAEA